MNEHERCLVAIRFLLTYAASATLIALGIASFDNDYVHFSNNLFARLHDDFFKNVLSIMSVLGGIFLLVSLHIDFYLAQTKYGNPINEGKTLLRILWSWIAGILLLLVSVSDLSDLDDSAFLLFTLCIGGLLIFWSTIEKKLMKSPTVICLHNRHIVKICR